MNGRIRFSLTTLLGMVAVAGIFLFNAIAASAQPIAWSPPCGAVTKVHNATGCTVTLLVRSTTQLLGPVTAGPGQSVPLNTPPPQTLVAILTQGGNWVFIASPGPVMPPPAPPIPATGWVRNVTLGGCCVDIYFDATNCVIWILPSMFPPPCIP